MEYVWLVVALAVMAFLAWLGFRIEPHWVAKDRSRFICNAQLMTEHGDPLGRFRETKVLVEPNGEMLVDQRRFFRRHMSAWRVVGESESPPRNRAVFLLRGHDPKGVAAMLAVRVPAKSPAIPILRDALERRR
ncbi:MAG: hypothetical protein U0Q03_00715 [Acidimicrobiales bacterium]